MTTVDEAADAFRAVRLTQDEGRTIYDHRSRPPSGWSVATGQRLGLPVGNVFGRRVVSYGDWGGPAPIGGDLGIDALAKAIAADPAAGQRLADECRATAERLQRAGEAAVGAKIAALGALVVAILEQ